MLHRVEQNCCQALIRSSFLLLSIWGALAQSQEITPSNAVPISPLYQTDKATEKKITELLQQMTLKEKVLQLASHYPNGNARLGIPHMQAGECLHGVVAAEATTFPQAIALGSTWDPQLIESMATLIAREARALGIHHCYSPMLGLARDPRWGRADESYSEDPYLVSRIGVAFINGLQGRGAERFDRNHILATAKHFVADGEPLAGDNGAAVEISLRSLHEAHLLPFKAAVEEAKVGAIMPAHHSLNGVPCHINDYLLVDVLQKQYGFGGLMVSDNNDILRAHTTLKATENRVDAIRRSLECGITTELAWLSDWGDSRVYGPPLIKAVEEKQIPIALVDQAVRKVLEYKFKLGLFQDETAMNPANDLQALAKGAGDKVAYADTKQAVVKRRADYKKVLNSEANNNMALKVANKSLILLENNKQLLPLDRSKLKTIAVIGPNANRMVLGGYSNRNPRYFVTIVEGIQKHAQPGTQVLFAQGVDMHDPSEQGIPLAVKIAKKSDVVILAMGGDGITMKENEDRDDITMAGPQRKLIQAIVATEKPVVLVLIHGRALEIGWEKEHVEAILDGWYLGQETGNAVAQTLFGDNNPGGKLPVTYPKNIGQVPIYYNQQQTARPRKLYKATSEPLYPFGHGLSYTSFQLTDFKLSAEKMKESDTVVASVTLTNTGTRRGDEVVQLYVRDEYASRTRPLLELKGFQRVTLDPGKSQVLKLPITRSALQFWKNGKWIIEPGTFTIMLGTNSVDLQSKRLTLE